MKNKIAIIREFLEWGSGFKLEAERDMYDEFSYQLTCYGLYASDVTYIGYNIVELLEKATKEMAANKKGMESKLSKTVIRKKGVKREGGHKRSGASRVKR